MKKLCVLALLVLVVAVLGCEKKTTITTPAGKISVTESR